MIYYLLLRSKGCANARWVGDGNCDDITNILICNYDGGDCCIEAIITDYCSECRCFEEVESTTATATTTIALLSCNSEDLINDGYCDDITNTMICNYDGGDCCLSNIRTPYCTDCKCLGLLDKSSNDIFRVSFKAAKFVSLFLAYHLIKVMSICLPIH